MMRFFHFLSRSIFVVLICIAALFGFAVWKRIFPTVYSLHYRMTLVVDDNGRQVEGSTVVEVSIARSIDVPYSRGLKGEALAVDLGSRGILFAVLRGADGSYGYWETLPERELTRLLPAKFADEPDRIAVFSALAKLPVGTRADLPLDKLPMLVRFRDISDPKSVERVDPNDLATSFGPGVKLVRATIEITNDLVTTRIEKYAPSYRNRDDWRKWFQGLPYGDPRQFGPEAFRTDF
jgi:hypothetical protein